MQTYIDLGDIALRLAAAVAVGVAIGVDREWRGKPVGVRTLAMVSLGSALVCVATVHLAEFDNEPDALSRVVQGVIQGVLPGIGFLGAGVVLQRKGEIENLTTAATVWVTAALGIACGLASWGVTATGVVLSLIVLVLLDPLDDWIKQRREARDAKRKSAAPEES